MTLPPIVCASLRIDNLKGFQKLDKDQRIVTSDFLWSSRELARMLNESFGGRIAALITNELIINCDKIQQIYGETPDDFKYLDDLIGATVKIKKSAAPNALIWLNMGIDLVVQFFTNILVDGAAEEEDLRPHIIDAYERTLKPHHNYFLREISSKMYGFLPTRSKLLGEGAEYLENLNSIGRYLPNIRDNVRVVYDICNKNNVVVC